MKRITIFWLGIIVALLASLHSYAQEEKTKQILRIGLVYSQTNNQGPVLKVSSKIKEGKKFVATDGVEVSLFFMSDAPQGFLGRVKTNRQGNASFGLSEKMNAQLDSLSPLKFIATVAASDRFDEQTTEIEITRARIELSLSEVDSVRKIKAKVFALQDKKWTPVPQTEIKLVVKRLFQDFPIGETASTTNDAGEASSDFTLTIPGDANGNLIIGAKIDEHELYGSIQVTQSSKWGVPLKADDSFAKRTLWASRDKTPLWLLIFPNAIIATVWGFIVYLVFLIFRIRKIGIDH